jgi:UDPglucose 6-dehydrogenase
MIKYASNAFLATKIALINEIANLCERFEGADVTQVADGMGYDRRIGRAFLDAGLGFGLVRTSLLSYWALKARMQLAPRKHV